MDMANGILSQNVGTGYRSGVHRSGGYFLFSKKIQYENASQSIIHGRASHWAGNRVRMRRKSFVEREMLTVE